MIHPWQMRPRTVTILVPMGHMAMRQMPTGGFPVPESMSAEEFPPAVRAAILRNLEGPPKPAVTLEVMNETQASMIAPDLPFRANV